MNHQINNVMVYRNLHKNCFSVVDTKTGKVIMHTKEITLSNVKFKVRKGGRQKAILSKQKNVHAFVCGTISQEDADLNQMVRLSYNPFKYGYFFNTTNEDPVHEAFLVKLTNGKDILAKI